VFSPRIVTLDIEASFIRVLITKGRCVEGWASLPLAPGLVKDGLVGDTAALSSSINSLFALSEVPKKKVIASLTGLRSVPRVLSLPETKAPLLEEAVHRESKREMPVSLDELYLSWQSLGIKEDERQIFVLGVPRNLLDALAQALQQSRIKPYMMDLKPLALATAVGQSQALIIDLEPETSDVILVVNSIPVMMRTLTLKQEEVTPEDRIRQLTDELARTVEFYNGAHLDEPLDPATPAFVTGELSSDLELRDLLQSSIQYPVEQLTSRLKCPVDFPVSQYAVNIGLALKGLRSRVVFGKKGGAGFRAIDVNILPEKYRGSRLHAIETASLVIAGMILIALLFPICQLRNMGDTKTSDLEEQLGGLNQELKEVRLSASDIADELTVAEGLRQEHLSIFGTRAEFSDRLQPVVDALGSAIQVTAISETDNSISLEGEADSSSTVISFATMLEQMGAFSTVRIVSLSQGSAEANPGKVEFNVSLE
jgi:type IV pilus assembly protein PilM